MPAEAAQAIVDPTGLEVATPLPGKALVSIPFVRYIDSDLDAYNEAGIAFLVRPHDAKRARGPAKQLEVARGKVAVYVHHLPVNQSFTLEAGRKIWGYPKFLADVHLRDDAEEMTCELAEGGTHILTLSVRGGHSFRLPQRTPPTYTFTDGVLRRTEWSSPSAIGGRMGGAKLTLGEHPIAEELRRLGLPKRAFMTQTVPSLRASFGPPLFVR